MSGFEPKGMNQEEWAIWNENRIREWEMEGARGMRNSIPRDGEALWAKTQPKPPSAWRHEMTLREFGLHLLLFAGFVLLLRFLGVV